MMPLSCLRCPQPLGKALSVLTDHPKGRMNNLLSAAVIYRIRFGIGERTTSVYLHFIVKDIMAYLLLAAGEWKRDI